MSIIVDETERYIIDRTLMAVTKKEFNENELLEFFLNLKKASVDFFEIDVEGFHSIKEILPLENFMLRIEKKEQLKICSKYNIEHIVLCEENIEILKSLDVKNKVKILLEITLDGKQGDYLKKIREIVILNNIYSVRIKGINKCFFDDFAQGLKNIKLNICASDSLSMSTAIGFQAVLKGFNSITTAFCGKDSIDGTSALEEILISLKVIKSAFIKGETSILALMGEQYEKLTYKQLFWNKPIIGKNIFKYESGVHAAGIEKNPITYEPFSPELVGLNRRLALGKHSGKNSIYSKIKEIGNDFDFNEDEISDILDDVKRISILKKTEISDVDFIDICNRVEVGRNV